MRFNTRAESSDSAGTISVRDHVEITLPMHGQVISRTFEAEPRFAVMVRADNGHCSTINGLTADQLSPVDSDADAPERPPPDH